MDRVLNGKKIIEATVESGTARLSASSRLGDPTPELCDLRGEGIVDFRGDRVWMTDRVVTARMSQASRATTSWLGRPFLPLVQRLSERLFLGGEQELLYEGGAVRQRDGSGWKPPSEPVSQPKYPRHPLSALHPLEHAEHFHRLDDGGPVRGHNTEKVSTELASHMFDASVWKEIQGSSDPQNPPVAAIVWIDDRLRLRRLAFEGSRASEGTLWCITDFWEFGVQVPEG